MPAHETAWNSFFEYSSLRRLSDLITDNVEYVTARWRKDSASVKSIRCYVITCSTVSAKGIERGKYLHKDPFKKYRKEFMLPLENDTPAHLKPGQAKLLPERCSE